MDCALGALLVESVGGLVPSRRAAVAKAPKTKTKKKKFFFCQSFSLKEIALKVRDPQRLFLVQQSVDNAMFT